MSWATSVVITIVHYNLNTYRTILYIKFLYTRFIVNEFGCDMFRLSTVVQYNNHFIEKALRFVIIFNPDYSCITIPVPIEVPISNFKDIDL